MVLIIGGLSFAGKLTRQGQGQGNARERRRGTQWPGPVAGPGFPKQGSPWPQQSSPWPQSSQPKTSPYAPDPWAPTGGMAPAPASEVEELADLNQQVSTAPEPVRWGSMNAPSTEGLSSLTEGVSSLSFGSVAEERARFREEREQFRRAHGDSSLGGRGAPVLEEVPPQSPVETLLQSREGLAQAMLLTEVLGRPRALRPYGRR